MQGTRQLLVLALALCLLHAQRAAAVPPPAAAVSGAHFARWITHRVIPGERLVEIANRYRVEVENILEWNGLRAERLMLRAGQRLRIYTEAEVAARKRRPYTVREGDSWARIARRFDVSPARLRAWNFSKKDELLPGDRIVIWIDVAPRPDAEDVAGTSAGDEATAEQRDEDVADDPPRTRETAAVVHAASAVRERRPRSQPVTVTVPDVELPAPDTVEPDLPVIEVPDGGTSVGTPTRGRLLRGVQLPPNERLYSIRNPDHGWGSSHTVLLLQQAIARFRSESGYDRNLLICDMSRRYGGRFRPHSSHTSGRDVDIQLPTKPGIPPDVIPRALSQVDWDATWALVEALIATGEVKYIFLSRSRQRPLYQAALRAGATPEELESLIQYPDHKRTALVRHSSGHVKHLHVRFNCAPQETRCRDL